MIWYNFLIAKKCINKKEIEMSKKKNADLENGSIGKLLVTLAVPSIIAQIVNLLYNMVDRIFIGRMPSGDLAMAGVGIVTPIVLLVTAFSSLVDLAGVHELL